jgi:hypothetical protein
MAALKVTRFVYTIILLREFQECVEFKSDSPYRRHNIRHCSDKLIILLFHY